MTFEHRIPLEAFGQSHGDRPYKERQWMPGDVDAQESQGPINVHALETLGSYDRGVTMFRKLVREGIDAVAKGEKPRGFYADASDFPPTYANDYVVPIAEAGIDANDPAALRAFAAEVWKKYQQRSPMEDYRENVR